MHRMELVRICDRAVVELAAGSSQALGVLYDHMARLIYSIAYAIVENEQDAQDVLQDTLIETVKYAPTYRPGSNARAWILTIARHLAVDAVRKRKPLAPLEAAEELAADGGVDRSCLEVFELLGRLDLEARQIVVFRLYAGLSYREISQVMGLTVANAQKKYQRALKKLKIECEMGGAV